MTKDNGGPAFPVADDVVGSNSGMSLRDWFAGQVISSVRGWHPAERGGKSAAEIAYKIADDMLNAREKKNE